MELITNILQADTHLDNRAYGIFQQFATRGKVI